MRRRFATFQANAIAAKEPTRQSKRVTINKWVFKLCIMSRDILYGIFTVRGNRPINKNPKLAPYSGQILKAQTPHGLPLWLSRRVMRNKRKT
jgi:hypothetical protein